MQPAQQHGRFLPSRSSSTVRLMRLARVFSCFASSTQQINSFRAIGVRVSHSLLISFVAVSALAKSAGSRCTSPPASVCVIFSSTQECLVDGCSGLRFQPVDATLIPFIADGMRLDVVLKIRRCCASSIVGSYDCTAIACAAALRATFVFCWISSATKASVAVAEPATSEQRARYEILGRMLSPGKMRWIHRNGLQAESLQ